MPIIELVVTIRNGSAKYPMAAKEKHENFSKWETFGSKMNRILVVQTIHLWLSKLSRMLEYAASWLRVEAGFFHLQSRGANFLAMAFCLTGFLAVTFQILTRQYEELILACTCSVYCKDGQIKDSGICGHTESMGRA
jgi:hypothetical protein